MAYEDYLKEQNESLRYQLNMAQRALSQLEWQDGRRGEFCPLCRGDRHRGHEDNCLLGIALATYDAPVSGWLYTAITAYWVTEQDFEKHYPEWEFVGHDFGDPNLRIYRRPEIVED